MVDLRNIWQAITEDGTPLRHTFVALSGHVSSMAAMHTGGKVQIFGKLTVSSAQGCIRWRTCSHIVTGASLRFVRWDMSKSSVTLAIMASSIINIRRI